MQIRHERPSDHETIFDLTKAAFEPMSFSDGTEAQCVSRLREDGDLTISLVATEDDEVIGHIAFSPASIDGVSDGWFGLGPVSVWPSRQGEGIGGNLIRRGLDELRAINAKGCVLIGNPLLYQRFGFVSDGCLVYRDLPTEYVQWASFGKYKPSGILRFSNGLE